MIHAFIHGFILALGLILPLGAQNIFIFNQGAVQPRFHLALPAILTAFACDTILITLAVLGVSVVVFQIIWLKKLLFLVGLFFLLYIGWQTWRAVGVNSGKDATPLSGKKQMLFASSVSLLNPHAIMDTIGVISTNSLGYAGNAKLAYTLACISVSCLWFFGLAIAGKLLRHMDQSGRWMQMINRVSALLIWGVAMYMAALFLSQQ
ncbi:LysE family transporter [Aneurinibacillus sp. Ricciae_BoGa-3]|uniref:LysE/ArgO family amino acid transporter n=1 Tax=Aneurinibacillus sp. Ricciae_BoGa-3 TaxID=3022697 RepID=UPI0023421D3D|nr:LysE family transporter [Aneurinibacillus sp. Ricciae_BoGa-3]WCK53727.1 LysE family transporter [Aneurinibacillus sp. Ricciae_BoGa-3]